MTNLRHLLLLSVLLGSGPLYAVAEPCERNVSPPPAVANGPKPAKPVPPEFIAYYGSLFVGPVASVASATRGGGFVGASLGGIPAHHTLRAFTFPGFDLELGAIRAVQPGAKSDGFISFNLQPTWTNKCHTVAPYLTAGVSRFFVSGNALNFGAGVNLLPLKLAEKGYFFRLEARDYYTFADQRQHLVTLRVAFCFDIPDV